MTKLNADPLELAMLYLFLALIHHARYGVVEPALSASERDPLPENADLNEIIGWLLRGFWRTK
jgi:hypothetical protein